MLFKSILLSIKSERQSRLWDFPTASLAWEQHAQCRRHPSLRSLEWRALQPQDTNMGAPFMGCSVETANPDGRGEAKERKGGGRRTCDETRATESDFWEVQPASALLLAPWQPLDPRPLCTPPLLYPERLPYILLPLRPNPISASWAPADRPSQGQLIVCGHLLYHCHLS